MDQFQNNHDMLVKEGEPLPPRSVYHQRKRKKKKQISFPIIRLILALFLLLVIAAVTSPYWLY